MKKIILTAVIATGLAVGFTACGDPAKESLAAELEKAKSEFASLDSNLTTMQSFLKDQRDSVLQIAQNEPARKAEIDSVIKENDPVVTKTDSVLAENKGNIVMLDSLIATLNSGAGSTEEISTKWTGLKAKQQLTKDYAANFNMAMTFFVATKIEKDTLKPKEEKKKR